MGRAKEELRQYDRLNRKSDEELAISLINDFEDGFRRLFNTHVSYLRNFAYKTLRTNQIDRPDLAEDATQMALCKAYDALKRYEQSRIKKLCVKAWLTKIVHNETMDLIAEEKQWICLDPLEKMSLERQEQHFILPETDLLTIERREELHHHWEALTPIQRIVLNLFLCLETSSDSERRTLKQIAADLGMPVATVKSHKRRAIQRLRRLFLAQGRKKRRRKNHDAFI